MKDCNLLFFSSCVNQFLIRWRLNVWNWRESISLHILCGKWRVIIIISGFYTTTDWPLAKKCKLHDITTLLCIYFRTIYTDFFLLIFLLDLTKKSIVNSEFYVKKGFISERCNKKNYKHCYQLQKELFNELARNVITANWRKVSLIFVFKHQFRTEKMRWIKLRSFVCLNTVWPEKVSYILDWAESFQTCI